jgi:hypothetical protein
VPIGTPLRDLRRAYTRLIRKYKPEQFPEQFRLIREAYDFLLQFACTEESSAETPDASAAADLAMPQTDDQPEPDHYRNGPEPTADEPAAVGRLQSSPERGKSQHPPAPRLEEELDALWNAAIDGDAATAYRRFVQLSQQYTGNVDIYLRLWWLMSSTPGLGDSELAADILVRGLRATGLAQPLRVVYRAAIDDDPEEAFSERFSSLLGSIVSPDLLAELLRWRVEAAKKRGKWSFIALDVREYRERLRNDDEKIWLRFVFALADAVAWSDGSTARELWQTCEKEIKHYEYLEYEFSGLHDRFDWLSKFAPGFRQLLQNGDMPVELLELLRVAWSDPYSEARPLLQTVLGKIAWDPQLWLNYFDTVQAKSPGALALIGQLLDGFESELPRSQPMAANPDSLMELTLQFLGRSVRGGRLEWRRVQFLELCLVEELLPEQVAQTAASLQGPWAESGADFARTVEADWPLRYVSRAWQLFWA